MQLDFTKMHGTGNDFIVIDATSHPVSLTTEQIRRLADRHFGIGCDQLLIIERPTLPEVDFRYRIFNADGGEVEQCGNGARCFARFVRDRGLTDKSEIRVETLGGIIAPRIQEDGRVTVNMGAPRFDPAVVPFEAAAPALTYTIDIGGGTRIEASVLSMGNPHAVVITNDTDTAPVADMGDKLCHHPRFPRGTNVGFMQIVGPERIKLRVFERGAGETLACGTGACAAVVAGHRLGLLNERVTVELPGGELNIQWGGDCQPVWLTGAAVYVFEGRVTL
jgi:diaminopimelate epimerase